MGKKDSGQVDVFSGYPHPRKKIAVISEGTVTEESYFDLIKRIFRGISIRFYSSKKHSSPLMLLKLLQTIMARIRQNDYVEIWILADRDSWKKEELDELARWARENPNCFLAISNPKFEYWILLHYELAGSVTSRECTRILRRHLPHFKKRLTKPLTLRQVIQAMKRAKERDNPPCVGWPSEPGQTTVYRLLESIRRAEEEFIRRLSSPESRWGVPPEGAYRKR